jgi:CO/xanthine dehydrogenase Mo-binding subunit
MDGEAVRSCGVRLKQLEGKNITTIEGLAEKGELHPLQAAFAECSAVQCGFCTPGQIMAARALLVNNPRPAEEDIMRALSGNLCRCGTYPRILKAVTRAAAQLRGETLWPFIPEEISSADIIGGSVRRVDIIEKVRGETEFVADLHFENMLHGKVLWSEYPHAEITFIDTEKTERMPGVRFVLTSRDIPGVNLFGVLTQDQPVLAEKKVRFIGEPVAVVFAEDAAAAAAAVKTIKVGYKELPGLFSVEAALAVGAPKLHEQGNIIKETKIERGKVDSAFEQADVVFEENFSTSPIEHAYMETECAVAVPGEDGGVTVYTGNQSPFDDRVQLASVLGVNEEKVRVHHLPAGGSFGGKTELSVHAFVAIAALRTGRPARVALTRSESLRYHPKKHGYDMKYRIAAKGDGKIAGMDIEMISDGGAYDSWSSRVIDQSVAFGTGPYYVPNLRIKGTTVYTNNLVAGAMRGFGANQVHFAVESVMDILSHKLDIDPIALRKINALDVGLATTTGQVLTSGIAYKLTLEAIEAAVQKELLPLKQGDRKIGIGIASSWRSVAGGLGPDETAGATLELLNNGKLLLKVACTEFGQGSQTALCQIVAHTVGVKVDDVEIMASSTQLIPPAGGVMASRGVYLWGHATLGASRKMRKLLLSEGASFLGKKEEDLELMGGSIAERGHQGDSIALQDLAARTERPLLVEEEFALPKTYDIVEDANESRSIDPREFKTHHTNAYNTTAAAVAVDEETGNVEVLRVIAATDSGRIINPEAAKTQIEGAVIMGSGYALTEEFVIQQGINKTASLAACGIPRITMIPERIDAIFVDAQDPSGPLGSKGVAEFGVLAIAPAITNAIYDAIGLRVNSLPVRKQLGKSGGK